MVISCQPLGACLRDRIFGPFGVVDTGSGLRPDQRRRIAPCYAAGLIAPTDAPIYREPVTMERGGGFWSTPPNGQRLIIRKTIV